MTTVGPFDKAQFLGQGAIFGRDQELWLMWGEPQMLSERPNVISLFFPDYFLKKQPTWLSFPHVLKLTREQATKFFKSSALNLRWVDHGEEAFKKQFHWVQQQFSTGELSKAVPYGSQQAQGAFGLLERESLLAHGLQHQSGFFYGLWDQLQGVVGLSPETLISQNSVNQWASMALAGTQSRELFEKDPSSLLEDSKEADEHLKVVKDLTGCLKPLGQLTVGERQVKLTPHLAHLFTPFELVCDEAIDLWSMIQRLHPTAALGCYPREQWLPVMSYLNDILPRQSLGAPFAISFDKNQAEVVVAIRHVRFDPECLQVLAGCGVVEQSILENEFEEIQNKMDSIKRIFGIL